jgi:uncharacterized protein (DUF2236 family)
VPSIGGLLAQTGELVTRVQKRYDDTVIILDAILEHGLSGGEGLAALRRMNQMHRAYDISNDDMRYVLCTFVVTPIRWMDEFGWRPMTDNERVAAANYYHELGRHMGIRDIPTTWEEFATFLDDYGRANFGTDPAGRAVAESTVALFATFPPNQLLPRSFVNMMSYALMDEPLRHAFGFPAPSPRFEQLVRGGLKARAKVVRFLPPRRKPRWPREMPQVRTYPNGYRIDEVGTFLPRDTDSGSPSL